MRQEDVATILVDWDGSKRSWVIRGLGYFHELIFEMNVASMVVALRIQETLLKEHPYANDVFC